MRWRFSCLGCGVSGVVFLTLCGLFVWWNFFAEVPLKISPRTTLLTEPRTADGKYVDYAAYVRSRYPAEMKTEKNAAQGLVRVLGNMNGNGGDAETRARLRKELFESLGFDESMKPECSLTHVCEAFGDEELDPADPKLPLVDPVRSQAWVEKNSPALDAVTEVVRKAEYCVFPLQFWAEGDTLFWAVREPPVITWLVGRDLIFRANWRISQGDTSGALSDVLTCRKLGRMLWKSRFSFGAFAWGIRMENEARRVPLAAHPNALPTAEQWQTVSDSLSTVSCQEDCRAVLMEYELYAVLDLIQHDFLRKEHAELEWTPFLKSRLGRDWNVVFERVQKHWKNEMEHYLGRTVRQDAVFLTFPKLVWLSTRFLRSDLTAKIIVTQLLMVWDTEDVYRAFDYDAREKLARIGCALRLYQQDHEGRLPPAVSTDAAGKPLHAWRVFLLPYLGEKELFDKIRLEEPWNSPWNTQFHAQCPDVFGDLERPLSTCGVDLNWVEDEETGDLVAERPHPASGSTAWTWVADEKTGILLSESETHHPWMEPDPPLEELESCGRRNILTTDGSVWYQEKQSTTLF